MGNRESSEKLKQKDVKGLVTMTKFSKTELKDWHKDFLKVFPRGYLTKAEFRQMYGEQFPHGDHEEFANNVFQTFDKNQDNKMDFCEFMTALHFLTTTADPRQRLMWAFELYDTHNSDQTQLMISESRDYIKPPRFTKIFS